MRARMIVEELKRRHREVKLAKVEPSKIGAFGRVASHLRQLRAEHLDHPVARRGQMGDDGVEPIIA